MECLGNFWLSHANCHQEHDCRLLTLAIYAHAKNIALINLKLKPRSATWNDFCAKNVFVGSAILRAVKIHAWGTHKLGHDYALSAANNECSVWCLQREITHKHSLALNLASFAVFKLCVYVQRSGICVILLFALKHSVTWLFKIWIRECEAHCLSKILNWRNLLEHFF